nr:hypothetical protein [Xanthomonas phaseoli]
MEQDQDCCAVGHYVSGAALQAEEAGDGVEEPGIEIGESGIVKAQSPASMACVGDTAMDWLMRQLPIVGCNARRCCPHKTAWNVRVRKLFQFPNP